LKWFFSFPLLIKLVFGVAISICVPVALLTITGRL
jgi:hypothetical protein